VSVHTKAKDTVLEKFRLNWKKKVQKCLTEYQCKITGRTSAADRADGYRPCAHASACLWKQAGLFIEVGLTFYRLRNFLLLLLCVLCFNHILIIRANLGECMAPGILIHFSINAAAKS